MRPTDRQLFDYAARFADRSEKAGRGTEWPTLRQAAHRFRCRIADIEDVVEGAMIDGDIYFGIAVGIGIRGAGYANIEPRGECLIEAYGDPS